MFKLRLAACCVALALAAFTASPGEAARPDHNSTSVTSTNGVETYQWTHDDHRIKIRTEGGKLELTDDWTGIARLSPGTKVKI